MQSGCCLQMGGGGGHSFVSVTYGYRHLPEPYRSRYICKKMKAVFDTYDIQDKTRYSDVDPVVAHIMKYYRDMVKLVQHSCDFLKKASLTEDIRAGVDQFMGIMTYANNTTTTSTIWKLVSCREELRSYVFAQLGGEEWPRSSCHWNMIDDGDSEGVGRMVTVYERHTNLQEYVNDGGVFTGNIFRYLIPPIMFELSMALGM